MGDFNALTRQDYTNAQWKEICQVRALQSWELPQTDVTMAMTSHPKHRFPESKRSASPSNNNNNPSKGISNSPPCSLKITSLGLADAFASANSSTYDSTVAGPWNTCRFQTRIDYINFDQHQLQHVYGGMDLNFLSTREYHGNGTVGSQHGRGNLHDESKK
ncbi:hypothetical protein ACA910_019974 [Epithemia clementina (nom. ined.)]